ncbi:MAG: putative sulfate/molybdate transporter [Calditrichia bacterium]
MISWLKKIGLLQKESGTLKNQFNLHELSGGMGDLGTLLPLLFALIIFNGFQAAILFFCFGIVYILTGWYYKVPVSVQPLKAMSVIAIAYGFSPEFLSGTAFFYGILFILLSITGIIRWLQAFFSPALVRGVQLGIGLILAQKAIELVLAKGLILSDSSPLMIVNIILLLAFMGLIWKFQFNQQFPISIILIFISIPVIGLLFSSQTMVPNSSLNLSLLVPAPEILKDAIILLMIPQLPLTLGNAVYAASDSCHQLWGKQAERVNPTRLSFSIGLSNVFIGMLGGFPICHGAGGMGAHAQFGAKTGGATILMGVMLVLVGLIPQLRELVFLIPVPLLGAMLLFDSFRMILMVKSFNQWSQIAVAVTVGSISFLTRNLTIAIVVGWLIEKAIQYIVSKYKTVEGVSS